MKPFKKRFKSTEPTLLPADLFANLTKLEKAMEISADEALYNESDALLEATGTRAMIDGHDVTITKFAHPITTEDSDRTYYARIAQYDDDPIKTARARVIFDESPSAKTVTTPDAAALIFCDMGGNVTLLSYAGLEPIVSNKEHYELVRTIIDSIATQHDEELKNKQTERDRKRERRFRRIGASAAGVIVISATSALGLYATDDSTGPAQETASSSETYDSLPQIPEESEESQREPEVAADRLHDDLCVGGGVFGGSGYICDTDTWEDGSFNRTERVSMFGFIAENSYRACLTPEGSAIPTDFDPDTPC